MNIWESIKEWLNFDAETRSFLLEHALSFGIFFLFIFLSLLAGRYTTSLVKAIIKKANSRSIHHYLRQTSYSFRKANRDYWYFNLDFYMSQFNSGVSCHL